MFGLGAGEMLIILAFALIFIGPKKLPELARGLGKSIREFQKAKDDLMAQVQEEADHLKSEISEVKESASQPTEAVAENQKTEILDDGAETGFEEYDADVEHHSALTSDQNHAPEQAPSTVVNDDQQKKKQS